MGHKILKDHAYVFCQMFFGWRMLEDVGTFASLPEGSLTIDVLAGTCHHDAVGMIETHIAPEISAWFSDQLAKRNIPASDVVEAKLFVALKRGPTAKGKLGVTFNWSADSVIKTADRTYTAHLAEPHTWIPMFSSRRPRQL